ncbi:MAG TPA: tetratricopeptide repeat protein [Candidatus Saccharimonadales bacterium]|nr:tetratricopeptide repeat protein [Candidatus Saccharimonadales bacterium]
MERQRPPGVPQVRDILSGRYELTRQLGEGGFAIAYAGYDNVANLDIAVKVLKATSEKDTLEFSKEAYLMETLTHEHIVPILEYVPMGEGINPYIVMPLAKNESLSKELRGKGEKGEWVSIQRSLLLLQQASEGLQYLHDRKIIHRDIKPDNLLLSEENHIWVSDLGIAKDTLKDPAKTVRTIGTPSYMAPEQIRKNPEPASDQYSLAIVTYYLLTKTLPFTGGGNLAMQMKQIQEIPRSLLETVQDMIKRPDINPQILRALNGVIQQALAKDPEKRHGSVTLFTKKLHAEYLQALGEDPNKSQITVLKPKQMLSEEQWDKKELAGLLKRGLDLYSQENYERALAVFNQILILTPKHIAANFYKGSSLNALKKYKEAIPIYDYLLQLDSKNSAIYANKGLALNGLGRFEEALQAEEQAIELNPNESVFYYNKGLSLNNLERKNEALIAFNQCLALNPSYTSAHRNKGATLSGLKKYDEAVESFNRAIQLDEQDKISRLNKGIALSRLQRYTEAITSYDQAIQLGLKNIVYSKKGEALHQLGKYEEALVAYDQAITYDSPVILAFYTTHLHKATTLNQLGRYTEAIKIFDNQLEITPKNPLVYTERGFALFYLQRYDDAIKDCDNALALDPKNNSAYHTKSAALMKLGRDSEALRTLETAIAQNPSDEEAIKYRDALVEKLKK